MKSHGKNIMMLISLSLALGITGCGAQPKHHSHEIDERYVDEEGNLTEPIDIATHSEDEGPHQEYNKGIVLVKTPEEVDKDSLKLDIQSVERIYPQSSWHKIILDGEDTVSAVKYLRSTNMFQKVDYDYVMGVSAEIESIDVSSNPYASDLSYLDTMCINQAWGYGSQNHLGGPNGGGSSDVIIAVIDTGVDYNHIDLRNNIWTNTGEIPNNGIDDDNNGYIDDVRGWDCVNEDNEPLDDNGHGTHVAGIVAAENNYVGTVGVAFNCKVMPIKAGNSSGYFINSDIAQAIQYAYMNGASVINMSFGGSSISLAIEDALVDAYNQCILVAAAGNNSLCNQPDCIAHLQKMPFYPAALSYVIGVMSCNNEGTCISSFSNFDHYPFNKYEYEVYACGEQIISSWPNNKYARCSGTSMAAPVVSGIAALLRSAYPDRETHSHKFIQSQIVNTGPILDLQRVANAYDALTKVPTPSLKLYDYYIFDNKSINSSNNNNGIIDSGETIRIAIELQNRGGVASDVTASIDTIRNGDPNLVDPNIEIINDTLHLSDVGTYSVRDCGKIYENNSVVGTNLYFEVTISNNCPHNYLININLHLSYENGLQNDGITYRTDNTISLSVANGVYVPITISQDMVFSGDKKYIVSDTVVIGSGVNVTFEAGADIVFYENSQSYIDNLYNSPRINGRNAESLSFIGTAEKPITIHVSEMFEGYVGFIFGATTFDYCNIINIGLSTQNFLHSSVEFQRKLTSDRVLSYNQGQGNSSGAQVDVSFAQYSIFKNTHSKFVNINVTEMRNCVYYFDYYNDGNGGINYSYNNLYIATKSDFTSCFNILQMGASRSYGDAYIYDFNTRKLADLPTLKLNSYSENPYLFGLFKEKATTLAPGHTYVEENATEVNKVWPFIKNISIQDSNGEPTNVVGVGEYTISIEFNRNMNTSKEITVGYGTIEPYFDYVIDGSYVVDNIWTGTFENKAVIENGTQFLRVAHAFATVDGFDMECVNNGQYFSFDIDKTNALSMTLQANPGNEGIELMWAQDDYDTLMGYNIYRSTSKDGNYSKINPSIIPAGENTYLDDSCEPGQTYWYTFTVVLSDFSESAPAGKVSATARDTIAPTIYHTPVNQGYANNNLTISCTISDNIAVQSATLYYRTTGDSEWKSLTMMKANNRFSAVIFGSEVTMDGLQYYISATDGTNTVTRGSAESPFTIVVKDPSTLNNMGDVDGDGVITTKDALMIIKAINDEIILTDDQFHRADLNGNNELSSSEALRILQYVNGNVTTLEM